MTNTAFADVLVDVEPLLMAVPARETDEDAAVDEETTELDEDEDDDDDDDDEEDEDEDDAETEDDDEDVDDADEKAPVTDEPPSR